MNIAIYIAHDNPKRALTFVDELEDRCAAIGKRRVSAPPDLNWAKASACFHTAGL